MRQCTTCKQTLPLDAFWTRYTSCRECNKKPLRPLFCRHCGETSEAVRRGHIPKICTKCEETLNWCGMCEAAKPHSEFARCSMRRTRLDGRCKACNAALRKTPKLVEQRLKRDWLFKYGLTVERRAAILEQQGGACAICQQVRELVVDHDHESLVVRGLLCAPCNKALGVLGDNLDGLKRAVDYLLLSSNNSQEQLCR